jgi:hypothetical protein
MDGFVFILFAGPGDRVARAERLAERAGYAVTRLRAEEPDSSGYLELFDVATDPSVDVARWRRQTIAIATALMAAFGFQRLGTTDRDLGAGHA